MPSIEDVIKDCESRYHINFDDPEYYLGFISRQLKQNKDYKLNSRDEPFSTSTRHPYVAILSDNLLLFSYITGKNIIIAGYKGAEQEKKILSVSDLYLLRPAEIGSTGGSLSYEDRIRSSELMITDQRLWRLYVTIRGRKKYLKEIYGINAKNWNETITELGQDEEVIRHFGQIISYEMVQKCHSPNPYVYDYGGNRKNKPNSLKILLEN